MKKRIPFAFLIIFFLMSATGYSSTWIGVSSTPDWFNDAQVSLGWIFSDPTNPQLSNPFPLPEWRRAIGDIPTWSFDSDRTAWGAPGQWYIEIENLINDNPVKHFWLSWVYEFDKLLAGNRTFTNIDWIPSDAGYSNFIITDEWFTSDGSPTSNYLDAEYGRMTVTLDISPNPESEKIWLGLAPSSVSSGYHVTEVYLATQCVPIPGAALLFASSLIGIIGIRRKIK